MQAEIKPAWLRVWDDAIEPLLTLPQIEVLEKALRENDPNLIQGATTIPPPLQAVQDWPCESACALSFCGWQGDGLETVAEVEEFFARMCFEIDQRLHEPAACRWWLNYWDDTPREELIREVLPVVSKALAQRREVEMGKEWMEATEEG